MKNNTLKSMSIALLLSISMLPSCSLFEDATDISFDTTLSENLIVDESSTGENVAYSEIVTLDATSDPDIDKYADKIKGFTINKITYQIIENYNVASGATFSGSLSFGSISTNVPTVAATISNLNLNDLVTVHELTINQNDVNTIANMLKNDKAVKFYLEGFLSQTPVNLVIEITLDVEVQAKAL